VFTPETGKARTGRFEHTIGIAFIGSLKEEKK
jgi:hypothetical protein